MVSQSCWSHITAWKNHKRKGPYKMKKNDDDNNSNEANDVYL